MGASVCSPQRGLTSSRQHQRPTCRVSVSRGGTERLRGRKSPSPVWTAPIRKRRRPVGSVAEPGMPAEGKKASRTDRHPGLVCEVGRTWLQLRESRLKGG